MAVPTPELPDGGRPLHGHIPDLASPARSAATTLGPVLMLMLGYIALGLPILFMLDPHVELPFAEAFRIPGLVTVLYLLATLLLGLIVKVFVRGAAPMAPETWTDILRSWLPRERLYGTLIMLLVLPAFITVMLGFRTAITVIHPFAWDARLMQLDLWLHGGHQPWELLQPLLGYPTVTRFIDGFYTYGWFIILWVGVTWQTVHGREPVRSRYLLTFALCWVLLGTVAAICFSSAGPVYYARVTGQADVYGAMHVYLDGLDAASPLGAVEVQRRLWEDYTHFGGITAMPSLHLAQTTAVFLAAAATDRRLGWLMCMGLVLILLGSVHLGWHYAVDAYAGILGALLLWWVAGRVIAWWQTRTHSAGGPP